MTRKPVLFAVLLAAAGMGAAESLSAESSIGGAWVGAIEVEGARLAIRVEIVPSQAGLLGKIDIPDQGALGLALTNVRFEPPAVRFELPSESGVARFDGEIREGAIAGKFAQGLASGTFRLERPSTSTGESAPLPYREEEVRFETADGSFAGTLTMPRDAGPHPAVVLITGSGPQNRDEEIFGFRPFRVLADHLSRNGIAVLRCDDRGVGGTTASAENATTEDLARDVSEAVALLRERPGIDRKKIGLLGHSEGAIVAPLAVGKTEGIAFLVLLSGTGVTGERILLDQGERIARAKGGTDEEIARLAAFQRRVFAAVRSGEGWDALAAELKKQTLEEIASLPEEERRGLGDPEGHADFFAKSQIESARSPWFRFFLDYDPLPALEKVRCPVLALFGELDLQVPAESNRAAVALALSRGGNRDVTIRVLPGVNHLYQAAKTGSVSEYASLSKEFAPGFLDTVSGWIRQKSGLGPAPTASGAVSASAALGPVPEPIPAPPPKPGSVEAEAEEFLRLLEKGDFEAAAGRFGPEMKAAMSAVELQAAWRSLLQNAGPLKAVTGRRTEKMPNGLVAVDLVCAFDKGRLTVRVVLDRSFKVGGLWFLPL